tara:strand:- start:56 stop:412 length:357 start_codon:yes stop_codon:yes gene_type:complete
MGNGKITTEHQKTLQKINSVEKAVDEFSTQCIKSVNYNHSKIRVLELVLDQILEDQVVEHDFESFDEATFNKEYGFLFSKYFMNSETQEIIKVNFPEEEEDDKEEVEEDKEEEVRETK